KRISVEINNITLAHGKSFQGGAVSNAEKLTIRNSILSHNKAGGFGGAILNQGGDVTLADTTFSGNQVTSVGGGGGAVDSSGKSSVVTITGGAFTDNQSARAAGAIDNSGKLTVTGTKFTSNTAVSEGGAIRNLGTATLTNAEFSKNHNTHTDTSFGGAV